MIFKVPSNPYYRFYDSVNEMPIYKKGWKEHPGNYRPVRLTLVLGKIMEQIILSTITRNIEDNQVIRPVGMGS